MKVLLTTLNAKYIHKNLALRWLYVASPIKESTVIKEYTIKDDENRIATDIIDGEYDAICFSCYIWNIEPIRRIIKRIKQAQPKSIILLGGPEVSYDSEHLLDEGVDAICIGEGEKANWEYLMSLNDLHEIPGIMTKKHPNHEHVICDLTFNESLEDPYFLETDQKDEENRYLYLETSRGCPYNCEYCLSSADKHVRLFSEEYIFKILEKISKSKIKQVKLLDRTFNCAPQRALRIARYMNENCTNQIFQFEVVAETLSDELLDFFLHEADKKRFRFEVGVQSFNEKTLKAVGRYQNNDKLKQVITKMNEAGCILHVDLIAGLPYEDLESFKNSFNTLFSLHASELQCGILKCLKGTALTKKSERYAFEYDEKPPYEILKTHWLSYDDLDIVRRVAYSLEKYYNSGKFRRSIDLILSEGLADNAFDLFDALGKELLIFERSYHVHHMVECLRKVLPDDIKSDAIIMSDYMALFKQKPKQVNCRKVTLERKKECYDIMTKLGVSLNECYHYGKVELYYSDHVCEQVVLYNDKQTYPRRFVIEGNTGRELK